MLFHEIYGKYYRAVAKILRIASEKGAVTREEISRIVSESAFSQSHVYIPDALKNRWFLLKKDGSSILKHPPKWPITAIEKRWLRSIRQDPRIRLFMPPEEDSPDEKPLFLNSMFVYFDRYQNPDPFEDQAYIDVFHCLTNAIHQKRKVRLFINAENGEYARTCFPLHLEYSEKDDKFRLIALENRKRTTLNLSKIKRCDLLDACDLPVEAPASPKAKLVLALYNSHNALERAMLHFSQFEKETKYLAKGKYQITLFYDPRDEREILIRVLSFGPMLQVIEPDDILTQIKNRIDRQKNLQTS